MMKKSFIFCTVLTTLSSYGNTYTIYFSISDIAQNVVDSYINRINETLPGVNIKVEIVKKSSWFSRLVHGENSTNSLSFPRLALVYLVGGATASYLTIFYLIYRVYKLIKIISPFIKKNPLNEITFSKNEQTAIDLYILVNAYLKKHRIRLLFPYNEDYEATIEMISTRKSSRK